MSDWIINGCVCTAIVTFFKLLKFWVRMFSAALFVLQSTASPDIVNNIPQLQGKTHSMFGPPSLENHYLYISQSLPKTLNSNMYSK